VRDVVRAIAKAVEGRRGFGVFNIGSGTSHSVEALIGIIQAVWGKQLPVTSAEERRKDEIMDTIADISHAERNLGWKPTLTNGEMLYRAYRHYVDHRDEISGRTDASAHRRATDMGPAIRLLKWLS
jgi:nucleoside-diphosphate-sugar epimerase